MSTTTGMRLARTNQSCGSSVKLSEALRDGIGVR
jgi:hypothetical protein